MLSCPGASSPCPWQHHLCSWPGPHLLPRVHKNAIYGLLHSVSMQTVLLGPGPPLSPQPRLCMAGHLDFPPNPGLSSSVAPPRNGRHHLSRKPLGYLCPFLRAVPLPRPSPARDLLPSAPWSVLCPFPHSALGPPSSWIPEGGLSWGHSPPGAAREASQTKLWVHSVQNSSKASQGLQDKTPDSPACLPSPSARICLPSLVFDFTLSLETFGSCPAACCFLNFRSCIVILPVSPSQRGLLFPARVLPLVGHLPWTETGPPSPAVQALTGFLFSASLLGLGQAPSSCSHQGLLEPTSAKASMVSSHWTVTSSGTRMPLILS